MGDDTDTEKPLVDSKELYHRIQRLHASWQTHRAHEFWDQTDAFCILSGKADPDASGYRKSVVVQMYLLGFVEFPETLMVFTDTSVWILTSGKKYNLLEQCQAEGNASSTVTLELLKKNKVDGNAANYATLIKAIRKSHAGVKVGTLLKESPQGDLVTGFQNALKYENSLESIDCSKGLELCTGVKEESELEKMRWAAALSSKLFKLKFIDDMEMIIDEEKKVTHTQLSTDVEAIFDDPSKIKVALDPNDIEACFPPIVQSGGIYDLKPSAVSTDATMSYDVIMCCIGARYKGYCSNVGRTFFIDPTKSMERTYELLREAHDMTIHALRPGVSIDTVVKKIRHFIETRNIKLLPLMSKTLGFGIGLEFRESSNLLSVKNTTVVTVGMTFNVAFGFESIPIPPNQRKGGASKLDSYAVFLADTVGVLATETKIYTKVSKAWSKVQYAIEKSEAGSDRADSDDGSTEEVRVFQKGESIVHGPVDTTLTGTRHQLKEARLREGQRQLDGKETDSERRDRHQTELMARKREEALARLADTSNGSLSLEATAAKNMTISSYTSSRAYPKECQKRQVMVDMASESVLVPINGMAVPFHISTIKSVSKSEEDKATFLRINFYSPGLASGKDVSPAMQAMISIHDNKMFIKELGFRSTEAHNLNLQFRMIKELQKRVKTRLLQEKEESGLVIQEALTLTKDRRVPRLSDLSARPHLSGRKTQGVLEAHANGLRFKSLKGERLDLLYANIKHAIFQPCDQELVVLIHFYLRHPIMIGKKKYRNVQFFTEVMEASQTLDGRKRSMYDPDELDEENRERALRSKLNSTFKEFCRKVEGTAERAAHSFAFDIPYRELGFQGAANKEMVLLQPTVNCLVNLTDNPPFIVSLSEIEHVHFERVMFSSKNFDLMIIVKDFKLPPLRISAIPMLTLDSIKEWLDDIDLCFTTGTANLNWKTIMTTIKSDDRFYLDTDEEGIDKPAGWEFLKMEGSDDDDEDEEDLESNYSDASAGSEEDNGSSSEDSDDSDEESLVDEEDDSSDGSDGSNEENAPTWDELEKEAKASDRMKGNQPDESAFSNETKKRKGKSGNNSHKKRRH